MDKYNSIEGVILFRSFAAGSKSASMQPYLLLDSGELIRVFYRDDNPYENETLKEFEGKRICAIGYSDGIDGIFHIQSVEEI